jgi:IS605 OrfB family transposase
VKTFEYRLNTTREQKRQLMACLIESRHLYNQMLEVVKTEYEASGKFLTKYDLVKNHHLAKSISDASWNMLVTLLSYKAESAGHRIVTVPAYYTSQKCFKCGELVPKSLFVRTHVCSHCGYTEDRDVNAAKNILRAGTRPSEGNVGGCVMRSLKSPSL